MVFRSLSGKFTKLTFLVLVWAWTIRVLLSESDRCTQPWCGTDPRGNALSLWVNELIPVLSLAVAVMERDEEIVCTARGTGLGFLTRTTLSRLLFHAFPPLLYHIGFPWWKPTQNDTLAGFPILTTLLRGLLVYWLRPLLPSDSSLRCQLPVWTINSHLL